jgi:hypothetical protein
LLFPRFRDGQAELVMQHYGSKAALFAVVIQLDEAGPGETEAHPHLSRATGGDDADIARIARPCITAGIGAAEQHSQTSTRTR